MTKRFKNAVDALMYAFFNETLAKGTCSACAVGTMVAWGAGVKVGKCLEPVYISDLVTNDLWGMAFSTTDGIQSRDYKKEKEWFVKICIKETGYSADELARIEYVFDTNTEIHYKNYSGHTKQEIMEDQYKGLSAVMDVLCEIEMIQDPASYKKLFVV
ncbi:hypothetical protein FEM33_20355 [Dyadobacter flavalbus]|uniref:Uncharacterized protein n=1 Tax=Dyadobacter flavalbus TaxID=2579942 RepID=A0A5M8QPA5_9BACT|nr:hypothetical protein [Dyadobacter flavalbus]KAA6437071.1 hypothetical protein FEM33_20355 [Dyadobacter flavalbus]